MAQSSHSIVLAPGTVLGNKYQILRPIGQGGMGTVYLGYDSSLDLKVAIKVISPDIIDAMDEEQYEVALKRFQAEARIAAQIDHPNVIRIFGFNRETIEHDNEAVEIDYLVMELLAQRTLRDTMDESGFESEDEIKEWIITYMMPILEGVEKVHNSGIIHRDIKPENFFLKEGRPKLADFGLSMGLDQPSVTGPLVDVFGTLKYMSPEQFYNFSLAREPTDIFSLGRILYEVVEGPITEKIKPFTQVRISRSDTPFFKNLGEVVKAATTVNPKERIATAREFMVRLSNILYCPIERRRKANGESAPKEVSSNPAFLLLLVFLIGIVAFFVYDHEKNMTPPNQTVVLPNQNAVSPNLEEPQITIIQDLQPGNESNSYRARDSSVMQIIPALRVNLHDKATFGSDEYTLTPFYVSENPITNKQFVSFLNSIIDELSIVENDLYHGDKLILKLSEKIRDYEPILYNGKKFEVQQPLHAACAVLMVTGYGAEAYANHYGLRLLRQREWYALKAAMSNRDEVKLALPTPVINYPKNRFGIRGINELAEWGKEVENHYLVFGQTSSSIIESELMSEKSPEKYYTDTSFRVACDLRPGSSVQNNTSFQDLSAPHHGSELRDQ